MIRIFLFSTIFIFVSCGSYQPENAVKIPIEQHTVLNPYFSDPEKDYVYKMSIEVYGRDFGGLMIIKPLDNNTHRVALTTDFGNKLLDITISKNGFNVNYVIDELNRKILINMLQRDFRTLLTNEYHVNIAWKNDQHHIFQAKTNKNQHLYISIDEYNTLTKIVKASKRKEKVSFSFTTKNNIFAEHITIEHHNIPLEIQLTLMP